MKNKDNVWKITKWFEGHICYGSVQSNNNRCLTSSIIATDIISYISQDIARIAIERLFGTWQSNLEELPTYVDELLHTNPNTIVRWAFDPQVEYGVHRFRYVLWAFGPSIMAYQQCIPILCIDGTHLKANYIGKILTAVVKNANGKILPDAFAVVDNESNESWAWFLKLVKTHVNVSKRDLCIISDRHVGILNAMANQQYGWHHRYCLRHIRSNLMTKFDRNTELKKLCWRVGSTMQSNRYKLTVRGIKTVSEVAWKYLEDADIHKWTLFRDSFHLRWGNLTTNTAESLNNVLRHARMMPVKVCMDYTFHYKREHFNTQETTAHEWQAPLSKSMWTQFQEREKLASAYMVTCYNQQTGVYKAQSTYQRSGDGGIEYTVKYLAKKCTCERWQYQRMPCSHGIAVCHLRNKDPKTLISIYYTTTTRREQYSYHLHPLRDSTYWTTSNWTMKADPTRLITHRGRRQS
ncbi:uncharacterized protein [Rutidosis leptorrhynchoides]|uniref:uncharacterized protein n=1 Tax=Rutidosis leptorrhynchoides TaxID=125765 RepID=UPI003A99962F